MSEEHKKHEHSEHHHEGHEHHDAHKHVYMEHKQQSKNQSYVMATWILAGVSILLLAGLIVALAVGGKANAESISVDQAKANVQSYLDSIAAGQATVDSISDRGDLYELKLTVAGRQYDSYATKDGKILFPQGIDLSTPVPAADQQAQTPTAVPKTDKPVVELFVMSHCPYGTQAEKGILPAVRTLGDKIDFQVKFVYYAMHGEKEVKEQLIQYCIQSEQNDKYLKYLACFLNSSDGGSAAASDACIALSGVDTAKLESCKTATDTKFDVTKNFNDRASWLNGNFPKFNTDLELNQKYNIGGSPTLIINGVESGAGRNPASYLAGICAGFNNAPAECQTELSSTNPGPGFGYDSVGSAAAAGCGV